MNFKILIESDVTVPLGKDRKLHKRKVGVAQPAFRTPGKVEASPQEALAPIQAFNFYYLSENFESLTPLLDYKSRGGNGKIRLIRMLVTRIPSLTTNKIIKHLGTGAFGTTFLLTNDHVLKLFSAGLDNQSNLDRSGNRDLNRYEELANNQFGKKAMKSDLMIYDAGSISFKENGTDYPKKVNYAEMQKLVTLVDFYKLCLKDKITTSRQNIFSVMPARFDPFAPELTGDVDTLKDIARVIYFKRKAKSTEELKTLINRHSPWGLFADKTLYAKVKQEGPYGVLRDHYLTRNLTEVLENLSILTPEFAKLLLVQMVRVSKPAVTNLRDVRPLNIGILPQDSFTPVLYDY